MSEFRKDPITGRWVIVAPERGVRPSDFRVATSIRSGGYCPFCPGNEEATPGEILSWRAQGSSPDRPGWSVRVVPNRFPALHVEGAFDREGIGVYDRMNGVGAHEVIIETERHGVSLADLSPRELAAVFRAWKERMVDLAGDTRFEQVVIFKNKGGAAGATLEHEHSQLIALPMVAGNTHDELAGASRHHALHERCIFCDILRQERRDGSRMVLENERFVALCPWAGRSPFLLWILPRAHRARFEASPDDDLHALADLLGRVLRRLDRALEGPAYNLLLHGLPLRQKDGRFYHWRLEIVPVVTRPGGFEWTTGCFINPTPPEEAAAFLRGLPDTEEAS